MNTDHLVSMANQIGTFFEAMPDRDEGLRGIADHLRKFWAPPMRRQLSDHALHADAAGLSPIVLAALRAHTILPIARPVATSDPVEAAERHEWDGASES